MSKMHVVYQYVLYFRGRDKIFQYLKSWEYGQDRLPGAPGYGKAGTVAVALERAESPKLTVIGLVKHMMLRPG